MNCTDYWNGREVVPITSIVRTDIKALIHQWEADDFDSIGFSYKPVTPDFEKEIKRQQQTLGSIFDKEAVNVFMKKQIFLGFTALKHHKRADTKV